MPIHRNGGIIPDMNSGVRKISIFVSFVLLFWAAVLSGGPNEPEGDLRIAKAAVIVCKGDIDHGLYKSIQRRTEIALGEGAEYLIYEIGTYGGLLSSADDISKYFILREGWPEAGKEARTVAYITTEAISAGSMISVSCQDIIMLKNTTIGDCAPIMIGGKLEGVEREKIESFTRGAFKRAAKANDYPEVLLKAMVTMQTEVYRIENLDTGEKEFFEAGQLPKDPNMYDLDNKELIVRSDELLTLTDTEAMEYGIARAQVESLDGVLEFLGRRDGVRFAGEPEVLWTSWSEEMVRWLNSPAVMAVLVMLALLGVYIEFNTPGVGLPGLVAVICFAAIIGSKYLVDLANWVEVALFAIGLVLLMMEIFVLPGFGIAGVLGISCIIASVFGMLVKNAPDKLPWPESTVDWQLFAEGLVGLFLGFGGFLVLAWILAKYLPRLQLFSGLILAPRVAGGDVRMQVSMTSPPESETAIVNVGDAGEVVLTLRPTGKARFGDAIVDVVAEAEFVDRGTKVVIIEIHGNRVVVSPVED